MTTAGFMVWSQRSTCLLIIASSNTTVIPQQFASRLAYPSAPRRLLQASNWAQLDFYWGGHSFHHQAGETLRGEPSPLKSALQVKDLVPNAAHTTDIHVLLHLLLSMYCDDTAVLLLVDIVSRATVVSSVVWARMQGANGGDRNGLCVCWRQEECA